MDTFFEQLVKIQKNAKEKMVIALIWIACFIIVAFFITISFLIKNAFIFAVPLALLMILITIHLNSRLNLEFEYINTNGEIDIDCIINKAKRQRMATFLCSSIEKIERFDQSLHKQGQNGYANIYFACSKDTQNYAITVRSKKGAYTVVMNPSEEFIESMKKFLPYHIKNNF